MDADRSKSLAELTGFAIGPPPASRELRSARWHQPLITPLGRLSVGGLQELLDVGFGAPFLITVALDHLQGDPELFEILHLCSIPRISRGWNRQERSAGSERRSPGHLTN